MTEDEVTKVLGDLHMLHLVNEPNNIDDLIYSWLAFFHDDDARLINKACYIYTKLRKNRFWPTPGDIEDLKLRASWLLEMEDEELELQKKLNALGGEPHTDISLIKQKTKQPPRAPAIKIEPRKCELHSGDCTLLDDLCDGPVDGKCPFEGL